MRITVLNARYNLLHCISEQAIKLHMFMLSSSFQFSLLDVTPILGEIWFSVFRCLFLHIYLIVVVVIAIVVRRS